MAENTEPDKVESPTDIFDKGQDFKVLLEPAADNPRGAKSGKWDINVIDRYTMKKTREMGPLPYELAVERYSTTVDLFRDKASYNRPKK